MGWKDGWGECTLTSRLSSLGSNLSLAIRCHPGVSLAGWHIPWMDVQLGVPSAGIGWWTLNIPWCPPWSVGEILPTPWRNIPKFLPYPRVSPCPKAMQYQMVNPAKGSLCPLSLAYGLVLEVVAVVCQHIGRLNFAELPSLIHLLFLVLYFPAQCS